MMREAMFYHQVEDRTVCQLCPNKCIIKEGESGICGTRKRIDDKLYAANYSRVGAIQIDPIEKKPLFNWHPGTDILSIGSFGCNLHCPFCQNHELVGGEVNDISMTPEAVVARAKAYELDAIAYTYNEPTVFYEMVYDTAVEAKKQGLYNVLVTNGYINQEPLVKLLPYVDAMNVDIKSYDSAKLMAMCGARLNPVIEMIKTSLKYAHVEVTMLLVPELFDDLVAMDRFFKWLYYEIGDVTVHLSRYFPRHEHTTPATDIDWMIRVQKLVHQYFTEVYLGNVN